MDYAIFVLIILALAAAFYLLRRSDVKTKNKHKKEAYRILDAPTASRDEVIQSIKMLRLYGGRWRKDKEFIEIVTRLIEKLKKIESA